MQRGWLKGGTQHAVPGKQTQIRAFLFKSSSSKSHLQVPPRSPASHITVSAMASAPRLRHSSLVHRGRKNDSLSTPKARIVLLSFDELPKWLQDNEFIFYGYRLISGSVLVSFRSWLYIHNESVNIYSHLIPAIVFLLGEWYIQEYLTSRYSNVTSADFFIFTFFLSTAIVCLGLSTTYHTLMNHSPEVEQLLLRLDLVGIVLLTLGDFVSGIYMVFWCEPLQRKIYWSMVSQYPYNQFYWFLVSYPTLTLVGRLEFLDRLPSSSCLVPIFMAKSSAFSERLRS